MEEAETKNMYFNNDILRNYMKKKGIEPHQLDWYYAVPAPLLEKYLNNEVVVPLSLIVKLK